MAESVDVKLPIQWLGQKAGAKRWHDVKIVHTTIRGLCVIASDDGEIFQVMNAKNITREFGYRNTPAQQDDNNVLDINDYKER